MTLDSRFEEFVRLSPAGRHSDPRRTIVDVPVGYLHGRRVAVSNVITLSGQETKLPLGQHFHYNYAEVFVLAHGSGELHVRAVVLGERNKLKPEIIVPTEMPQYFDLSLAGAEAKLVVDSKDDSMRVVRVAPGIAHTFVLKPGSVLIPYLIDTPEIFNPSDKENYLSFPLI